MISQPRHLKVDHIADQAIALEEPCAVLLENGIGFSVLVARRISSTGFSQRFRLELCFQFRIESSGQCHYRGFTHVEIFKTRENIWVAEEQEQGRWFSCPSEAPYQLIYLSREAYSRIRAQEVGHKETLLYDYFREQFGALPGFFSPDKLTLEAPPNYATLYDRYADRVYL